LLLIFFFFSFSPHSFEDEGWLINRFSSDITIEESGSVLITETIEVDFGSLEKHGIYRDIPEVYKQDDGAEYHTRITPLQMLIRWKRSAIKDN